MLKALRECNILQNFSCRKDNFTFYPFSEKSYHVTTSYKSQVKEEHVERYLLVSDLVYVSNLYLQSFVYLLCQSLQLHR